MYRDEKAEVVVQAGAGERGPMSGFLILTAAGCLVLSLVAHGSTFVGVNLTRHIPEVWWLHVATLAVGLAAFPALLRLVKETPGRQSWEYVWLYSPTWLQAVVFAFFIYACFNFFYSFCSVLEGGQPLRIKGELVLANHGKVIRKLTPEQYEMSQAYALRGFSGHWMLFSSGSLMILIAYRRYRRSHPCATPRPPAPTSPQGP